MDLIATTALFGIAVVVVVSKALTWQRSYSSAKSAGFSVFLSPVHIRDTWWLVMHKSLVPCLERLPKSWTQPWLPMGQVFDIWKIGYEPFDKVGSDTFMLSTPRGNILWTCDPKVCHQLEASYPGLQKAVDMLKFLDIYGPTVASVEGETWRMHRKVIMSGFTPSINANVWKETTEQTKMLLDEWAKQENVVGVMHHWTSRLSLHVLSSVFYDKKLTWGVEAGSHDPIPEGHELSFEQALFTILQRLGTLLMIPRFFLSSLPIKTLRETNVAFVEFTKYIKEMISQTKARQQSGTVAARSTKTILECIVGAGTSASVPLLSEESVLGNVFFVFSAGHETTGNTLSFALTLLAIYPEYQAKVCEELDQQLALRAHEEWTVEREFQTLQNGWLGAVLKETLRLYCVVSWLPRSVTAPIDVIDSQGRPHTIPQDTMVLFNFAAAFQNPNIWPRREMSDVRRAELHDSPAADFDPSRWLAAATGDKGGGPPLHFPFGQGVHACPGRLFSLVEMTAALAAILSGHSLELVVDEKTKRSCGGIERAAWERTRDAAMRTLVDDISTNQNIELRKELPIRIVKRR